MAELDLVSVPKGYGTIPWWIWNGRMDYGEIRRQLRLMKEAGLEAWMLWARFGLEIEYLSHEFMTRFQFAVEESARLGLDVWIYDEYAWPSGNARNHVQEIDPDYRMRVLSAFTFDVEGGRECRLSPHWGEDGKNADGSTITTYLFPTHDPEGNRRYLRPKIERVIAVSSDGQVQNLDHAIQDLTVQWTPPPGKWQVLVLLSRDFGSLIDHLNPRAVRTFLDLVHEKYKRYVGNYFGTTIKGFFSDETRMFRDTQHRFSEPTVAWTKDLFGRLADAGIADLDQTMLAVFSGRQDETDQARRLGFWQKMTDFYADSFYRQITEWAAANGIVYTGDCFSEDTQTLAYLGDYFKCTRHYHIPGLDSLCLPQPQHREFYKSPKFPSSVAHAKGEATRCLAEGPGLLGWDTTMEGLRRVTDWLYVFGVNLLVPNALMYTIAHEQLYETPSYFFQWTLWPFYRDWDTYVKRLGYVLTRGRHVPTAAVLYPTASQLARFRPVTPTQGLQLAQEESVRTVTDVAYGLLRRQIDFDYVTADLLTGQDLSGGEIRIGEATVKLLVLAGQSVSSPALTESLRQFARGGGTIISVGDSESSEEGWTCIPACSDQADLEDRLEKAVTAHIDVPVGLRAPTRENFAIHLRQDRDEEYLFLVYFGDRPSTAALKIRDWSHCERCDLLTGTWHPAILDRVDFAPYGSVLLRKARSCTLPNVRRVNLENNWHLHIPDDNLFVPEPLTVTTEWLDRKAWEAFLRYRIEFRLHLAAPSPRCLVLLDEVASYLEQQRLRVRVNDRPVAVRYSPILDPALVAADLAPELTAGENTVVIELDHSDYDGETLLMLKHRFPAPQLRPRVFGQFLVRDGVLHPLPDTLPIDSPGDLAGQGLALYSGRMIYRQTMTLPHPATLLGVEIEDLANHAVIRIDGREAARILWRPFRADCRFPLPAGPHTVEIEVVNTQGNQMFEHPLPLGLLGKVSFLTSAD